MAEASLGNGVYTEVVTDDALARPTETSLTRVSDSARLFDSRRAYDAVGNVANVWTTLPGGTDYQAFCYDEQNRLTWASSASGSVPCGGSWTAGSLSSGVYTNSYTYDVLNRLTSGPLGSYTYGSAGHLDAVTAIGSTYTAAYDAAGNMTCRAPTSSTTCAGTQTGAQLTYDNEGRLSGWQNQPTSPTSTTSNLYDGEGNRVEQQVTNSGTTTTVTYVSNIEEVSTAGSTTTLTTSYYAGGQRVAQAVNGVFSYLGSDGLGSAQTALDASGTVQASVLYGPYGSVRYSDGTMPGTYAFTGQHADATTGLDYFQARYYDPVAGQFASADSEQDGLNRYAYVGGNPTTATDPSGHRMVSGDGGGGGCTSNCGGGGGGPSGGGGQPGSSGSGSSDGALTWTSWQLSIFGYQVDGYGLAIALQQRNVRDVVKRLTRVIINMVKHPSRIKSRGQITSRVDDLGTAEAADSALTKFGWALVGVGALLDLAGAAIAFYNGDVDEPRWDLDGSKRLEAAVLYGLVHSVVTTVFSVGGGLAVGVALTALGFPEFALVGNWLGGLLGGLLGAWVGNKAAAWCVDTLYVASKAHPARA